MAEVELIAEFMPSRGIVCGNPLALPAGALVDARNVVPDQGRLKKRRGYTVIKANGVGGKPVRFCYFFRTAAGDARLIAATQTDIYSWDPATGAFLDKGNLAGADIPQLDACKWGMGMLYLAKLGSDFQKWDGGSGDFSAVGATAPPPGGGAPQPFLPTYLRAYGGCLIGANCNLGGTQHPQALYWSAPGLPDDWNGAGSGWSIRTDLEGAITGLERVGRALAVFAEENVEVMVYTGAPWRFDPAEPAVGTPSPQSIRKLGPPYTGQIAFLGSDFNIHTLDGQRCVPRADDIHPLLRDLLELDYLAKAYALVWPHLQVYRLAVPTRGSTENNLIIDWHYGTGQFYLHEVGGGVGAWTAAGRWIKSAAPTWAELEAQGWPWNELDMTWAELMQETGWRPVGFLGSAGDFVGLFEGLNDGSDAVNAWAQFAPREVADHNLAEPAYLAILDDRIGSSSTLSVGLGASRDGAHFAWDTKSHSLAPTDEPFVDTERTLGRWFSLRVANAALGEQMGLRAFRLWGLPQVGAKL